MTADGIAGTSTSAASASAASLDSGTSTGVTVSSRVGWSASLQPARSAAPVVAKKPRRLNGIQQTIGGPGENVFR
jgi:hypothetical protein